MPIVGFRFRAYADRRTLRALKAQLEAACEVYNTLRWARHAGAAHGARGAPPTTHNDGQGGARKREAH